MATLAESIEDELSIQYGYHRHNAARLARSWAWLAEDKGWGDDLAIRVMRECVAAGITPDMMRSAMPAEDVTPLERLGILANRLDRRAARRRQRRKRK
jgi:hypothetical protein